MAAVRCSMNGKAFAWLSVGRDLVLRDSFLPRPLASLSPSCSRKGNPLFCGSGCAANAFRFALTELGNEAGRQKTCRAPDSAAKLSL